MKAIIRGYFFTLTVLIMTGLVFYFSAEISGKLLYVSRYVWILLFIIPVIGGFVSGWHCEKGRGFKAGAGNGLMLFLSALVFMIWFLPDLIDYKYLLTALVYLLIIPSLAGGFAYNLKRLKPVSADNKN